MTAIDVIPLPWTRSLPCLDPARAGWPECLRRVDPDCAPAYNPLATGVVEERWSAQEDGTLSGLYGLPSPDQLELGRKSSGPAVTAARRRLRRLAPASPPLAGVF